MSVEYVVQSGLNTPEDISLSFEPPSSQQLWTPPQQERTARISLQRKFVTEGALANNDFSVSLDRTLCPLALADPGCHGESAGSHLSHDHASATIPSTTEGFAPLYPQANVENPSQFDISPPLQAQPPPPVVLKAHQRANLENRFHARVDSPTPSEDTYQRLLKGCYSSESTTRTAAESYHIDPASLLRPNAPEPTSFTSHEDQQAEIGSLRNENAGLLRQLQAYKDMADSLIEQTVEHSFSGRDERGLNRRLERLQRRLDKDDGIITQQKMEVHLITKQRDSLESALQDTYEVIKMLSEDINHQADRIEDLEGDLHDAYREIYSLIQRH